ncbi:HAD family acid phosphatase [Acidomonas methanolica]|uniref:HAD family acid phosphatase n=1 Tax=Acidomonas methanolica TaxID=437 RepID=UPI00211A442D|nr:HAD family acid phosphatase [Acidomonas methanolica]MCQ9154796.1 HAD family acid phosphatase [Acidomonas methanolica]
MRRLLLVLLACAGGPAMAQTVGREPANVGDAAMAASAYHDSGHYEEDLAAVLNEADAWIASEASRHPKPAVVMDIDETSLSNWPVIRADRFAYFPDGPCDALPKGPCGWAAWEKSGKAAAIPGALALFRHARALHVAVFFITGRREAERAATDANLRAAGYAGWSGLVLRPDAARTLSAAAYKAPARAAIEAQGYSIIANIGDQPSDLAGGHAVRGFLLPNPFYRVP